MGFAIRMIAERSARPARKREIRHNKAFMTTDGTTIRIPAFTRLPKSAVWWASYVHAHSFEWKGGFGRAFA